MLECPAGSPGPDGIASIPRSAEKERNFTGTRLVEPVAAIETLVLIPESTRKAKGGAPAGGGLVFDEGLPRDVRKRIGFLRDQVREAAPDAVDEPEALLPAFERFRGNMYRAIGEDAWTNRVPGVEVVIVSGLYGLVASRDLVVRYEVSMAESLERLGKLNRWWRDHGLPSILHSYLEAVHPADVVDLLSLEYREAVEGYANELRGTRVKTIDFRGLGRGSQPRRGRKVAELLLTGKIQTTSEDSKDG